jgi:hypothetical protein
MGIARLAARQPMAPCRSCYTKSLLQASPLQSQNFGTLHQWSGMTQGSAFGNISRARDFVENNLFQSQGASSLASSRANRSQTAVDLVLHPMPCSRRGATFQTTVLGMICAAWIVNSTPLYSSAEAPEDDIWMSTAQLQKSVTELHASVLSLEVVGKSPCELQKELDLCNALIGDACREWHEIDALKKQVKESTETLAELMGNPLLSTESKTKIHNKIKEMGCLQAMLEKRGLELYSLLKYRLCAQRDFLQGLLKQSSAKKE